MMYHVGPTGQSLPALVIIAVALVLMLSGPVQADIRPKPPVQEPPPTPRLSVAVWVDRKDLTYVVGETIKFYIRVRHRDAHVIIHHDNQVPLFPEPNQLNLLLKAGKTVIVACQSSGTSGKRSFTISATAIGSDANERDERTITLQFEEPDISVKPATAPHWHCRVL